MVVRSPFRLTALALVALIGVLLAGIIPLVGIIVEHFQTKKLKAQFGL